jgi:hypothetical protein
MPKTYAALAATGLAVAVGGWSVASQTQTAVAAAPSAATTIPVASGADAAHPAVIELYQSQGCSSCPPALGVLDQVANRPDVLALNFAVTYWDRLGWKDIYAQPAYTARQWDYSHAQGRSNVQTPQLIVNGKVAVLGSNKPEVEKAIAANARAKGPEIAITSGRVSIASGTVTKPATVWLVAYDPRTVQVPVRAGENGGRTLPHRNIVRQLVSLGAWTGKAASFATPASANGLKRAVLVQAGSGGPILAAARI